MATLPVTNAAGVYEIVDAAGRRYVGSAVNLANRWRTHKSALRRGEHHNPGLQAIFMKHGLDYLKFRPLVICSRENAVMYEQIAIDALRPCLNAAPRAGSSLGYQHTEEGKARMRTRKLRVWTDEQRAAHSAAVRRPLSPENYAKLCERAAKRRGIDFLTPEQRAAQSESQRGRKFGPMSHEQKDKISAANKGKSPSIEARAKMRAAKLGRTLSAQHRANIGAGNLGTKRK